MSCSSKRKASEALQDYVPESELYSKRFCHDFSNGFPSESRWSSSQSSQDSTLDGSWDEMFGHSMSTTPATTEATTPSDSSSCRFSTWGREEELRTALEAALINDFGPSPQGLPALEQQQEDEFWEGRGVTTVWWQADSGLWYKKPEVCLQFNTIDWSGTGGQQDNGKGGAWQSEKLELAPCETRTRIKLSRRKCS